MRAGVVEGRRRPRRCGGGAGRAGQGRALPASADPARRCEGPRRCAGASCRRRRSSCPAARSSGSATAPKARAARRSRALGIDGNCLHVVLEEFEPARGDRRRSIAHQPLGMRRPALFAVEGDDAGLLRGIDALDELAAQFPDRADRGAGPALVARSSQRPGPAARSGAGGRQPGRSVIDWRRARWRNERGSDRSASRSRRGTERQRER